MDVFSINHSFGELPMFGLLLSHPWVTLVVLMFATYFTTRGAKWLDDRAHADRRKVSVPCRPPLALQDHDVLASLTALVAVALFFLTGLWLLVMATHGLPFGAVTGTVGIVTTIVAVIMLLFVIFIVLIPKWSSTKATPKRAANPAGMQVSKDLIPGP